jgi:hypothetical protein
MGKNTNVSEPIAVQATQPAAVPMVQQDEATVPVSSDFKRVVREVEEREKYIQKIKQTLSEPYDNINHPVPFMQVAA